MCPCGDVGEWLSTMPLVMLTTRRLRWPEVVLVPVREPLIEADELLSLAVLAMQASLVQSDRSCSLILAGSGVFGLGIVGEILSDMENERPGELGGLDGGEYRADE